MRDALYWVLVGTVTAWFLGAMLAWIVSGNGLAIDHFSQSAAWITDLLGLATTIAGFLGISAAFGVSDSRVRTIRLEGGMIGLLGGATLLGTGGWAVPSALAVVAAGGAGVRIMTEFRRAQEQPESKPQN